MLRIRKGLLRLASVLYYCGCAVMVLALPYVFIRLRSTDILPTEANAARILFPVQVPGLLIACIGCGLKENQYRCPYCRNRLLKSEKGSFSHVPEKAYCETCRKEIEIHVE